MSSSAQHHNTFCTLEELERPQIFSMASFSRIAPAIIMEPPFQGKPDEPYRFAVADGHCCGARPRAGSCRGEPVGRSADQGLEECGDMGAGGADGLSRLN